MIDSKKRTTLKAISGVTAAAIMPASLYAATSLFGNDTTVLSNSASGKDLSISMVSGHGRWYSVKLTNSGEKAVTVKHVYPGLVSANGKKFDVNALFRAGPIVVEPGKSYVGAVAQQNSSAQELELPNNFSGKHSFELSTEYKHFGQAKPVITTRSFFA
jgi:hypothetical protein